MTASTFVIFSYFCSVILCLIFIIIFYTMTFSRLFENLLSGIRHCVMSTIALANFKKKRFPVTPFLWFFLSRQNFCCTRLVDMFIKYRKSETLFSCVHNLCTRLNSLVSFINRVCIFMLFIVLHFLNPKIYRVIKTKHGDLENKKIWFNICTRIVDIAYKKLGWSL